MSCPSAIGARSTSIGAPAAMVEASGFIWDTSGQTTAAAPTAAAAPVATKRKSRRVGSAEDAVVTIPSPFFSAAGGTAPDNAACVQSEEAAGARDPRGGRRPFVPRPLPAEQQSRIVLLAPLPIERKPAIGSLSCNALKPRMAGILPDISCGPGGPSPNADRAFPARHPPEYRDDSA